VNITPDQQPLIGVRVQSVMKRASTERLRLYGRVAIDETRMYTITAGIGGVIRTLSTATTGTHVRRDEWLATFTAPEARSVIQGYLISLDVLDRATKDGEGPGAITLANASVQQSVDRLLTLGVSLGQIEEIRRLRQVPPALRISAPVDGFVLTRNVSIGQTLERGEELYRIADLRRVWILADVFGPDAEYIRPGMVARVSVAGRTRTFHATVSGAVLPQFDPVSQSVKVRLDADNAKFELQPDASVDVTFDIPLPATIAVPADAVLDTGLNTTVFVERAPGTFERRAVKTGWRFGDHVEIVEGLASDERIAVSGTFLLDSESRMRRTTAPNDPQ
jgi:multidrug efflux pump subunit AcrA (membrane-fusion protein)